MYLFFDTSTPFTTIALGDDRGFLAGWAQSAKSHGPMLLPAIETLLADHNVSRADLTLVGCGMGPGSFTGIRIGMATAKAMSWGLGIDLVAFTGFEVLHAQAVDFVQGVPILTLLDARRDEVYGALFTGTTNDPTPFLLAPERLTEVVDPQSHPCLIGSGCVAYRDRLGPLFPGALFSTENDFTPEALFKAGVAAHSKPDFVSMDAVEPLYIRPSDAEKNRDRAKGAQKAPNPS